MPGGKVNDGSGLQLAPGKFRFRSTPAAFCRVPFRSPSGFATWMTAQLVSSPGIRSSRRRASRPVSASSPCWPAMRSPATGAPDAGSCTRSGSPPRERPYSRSSQPRSTFEVTASATASAYGQGVRRRSVAAPSASASTMQPATMPTSSHTPASTRRSPSPARARRRRRSAAAAFESHSSGSRHLLARHEQAAEQELREHERRHELHRLELRRRERARGRGRAPSRAARSRPRAARPPRSGPPTSSPSKPNATADVIDACTAATAAKASP